MTRLEATNEEKRNAIIDGIQSFAPVPAPRRFRPLIATGDVACLNKLSEGEKQEIHDLVQGICKKFAPLMDVFMTGGVPDIEKIDQFAVKIWGNRTRHIPTILKIRSLHTLQNNSFKKEARQWLYKSSSHSKTTMVPCAAASVAGCTKTTSSPVEVAHSEKSEETGKENNEEQEGKKGCLKEEHPRDDALADPPRTPPYIVHDSPADSDDGHPEQGKRELDDEANNDVTNSNTRDALDERLQRLLNGTRSSTVKRDALDSSDLNSRPRDEMPSVQERDNSRAVHMSDTSIYHKRRAVDANLGDVTDELRPLLMGPRTSRSTINNIVTLGEQGNTLGEHSENRGTLSGNTRGTGEADLRGQQRNNIYEGDLSGGAGIPRKTWSGQEIRVSHEGPAPRSRSYHDLSTPRPPLEPIPSWGFIETPNHLSHLTDWPHLARDPARMFQCQYPPRGIYCWDTSSSSSSSSSSCISFVTATDNTTEASLPTDGT